MNKLNWEKQNKAEQPKEKRRLSNRTKVLKAYENGTKRERERIIKLLEEHAHPDAESEYLIDCDLCERYYGVGLALTLIKGDQK